MKTRYELKKLLSSGSEKYLLLKTAPTKVKKNCFEYKVLLLIAGALAMTENT